MSNRDAEVEPAPRKCHCGQPAAVVRIEVTDSEGQRRLGAFSEFGQVIGRNNTARRILRDGFHFSRWVALCMDCFCGNQNQENLFDENPN